MEEKLKKVQEQIVSALRNKSWREDRQIMELIKYIPLKQLKQWGNKYVYDYDDVSTDDEEDDYEEEKDIGCNYLNKESFFDMLHPDGTQEALTSMDFVKEMLEIIRSRSMDWKDVKYNYLDYTTEYLSKKKDLINI